MNVAFVPSPPGLAAVLVEVDEDGRQYRPRTWPVIGWEIHERPRTDPRRFAVVLDRDGEAHPLHELLLHPDPVSGHDVRCVGFVSLGSAAAPHTRRCTAPRLASLTGVPA